MLFPFTPFLSVSSFLGRDFVVFSCTFSIAFSCLFFEHCFKAIFNPRILPSPCTCFHCIFIFAFSSPRRPFTFLRTACFAPFLGSRRSLFVVLFSVFIYLK
ncbi:hypothetical protein CPC08DRAFT_392333 [Agrocybe pediades]|nr:hypothetical protein CPC08DRAFT_392333 [Agrocybe pediades]